MVMGEVLGGGNVWLRCKEVWEGVTVVRKYDSPKEVCQLVGRCDGHGEKKQGMRCITWLFSGIVLVQLLVLITCQIRKGQFQ